MKEWTSKWMGSKRPGKQRKFVAKAPLHARGRFLSAHLSKDLREKHKCRSLRIRKGDKVKIMRGKFKGSAGSVEMVDVRNLRVFVAGASLTKKDGTKSLYPLHSSNLLITELAVDPRRLGEKRSGNANKIAEKMSHEKISGEKK